MLAVPNNCPVYVAIPDVLVPQALFKGRMAEQAVQTFKALPASLQKGLARQQALPYQSKFQLDLVEALLVSLLNPQTPLQDETYPAWAMLNAEPSVPAYTRWWASVGSIQIERDGVQLTPPEALHIQTQELQAYWEIVAPLLQQAGWSWLENPTEAPLHTLLESPTALPMQQASPWSAQHIRLTDYLPLDSELSEWRKLWFEIQMELKQAPFNQAREANGQPTLNCLWFWGGGEAWQPTHCLQTVYSVSADGLYEAVTQTQTAHPALNRLVFWHQLLQRPALQSHSNPQKFSLYCADFHGWGSATTALDAAESEVAAGMQLSGIQLNWLLLGQSGWRTLPSLNTWGRLQFWKNSPDWSLLTEPEPEDQPSEADLHAAWEAGQRQQASIQSDWSSEDR